MGRQSFEYLPTNVKPIHYDVSLRFDMKELTFSGTEVITIQVKEATDKIILNSVSLSVTKATLKSGANAAISLDETKQWLCLSFGEKIAVGEEKLEIDFNAPLSSTMKGLYKSMYKTLDGEKRYLACTQFEATDARRCFPCWDEPAIKATFTIRITAPSDRVVISNMPVESFVTDPKDSSLTTSNFQKSPVMSTYLVALVVGEYDFIEGSSKNGTKVRVYVPLNCSHQAKFALDVAVRSLDYYTSYFGVPYPLPKLDLITIPDFSAGAMENWGLITYREVLLLVDENSSSQYKQRVALVIAHELAHQWFGNIVTMQWWTHLWLNEGYANFSQTLCGDSLFPEYKVWTQFLGDCFIPALNLDALKNTHPIEVPVGHPDEVDEIFDQISYDKGASVIRMLHRYLGDADFRKGMNLYLEKFKYANTVTEDLWRSLEEVSSKPVEKVMNSWTKIGGFPMVSVEYKESDGGSVLVLNQTRFLANGKQDSDNPKWVIPIEVKSSVEKEVKVHLMEDCSLTIPVPTLGETDWIKINPDSCGFFRTKYDSNLLKRLIPAVRSKDLPPEDRLTIIDDVNALTIAGYSSTIDLLTFVEAYDQETDYAVYSCLASCLANLKSVMSHKPELRNLICPLIRKVFSSMYEKLGWSPIEGEPYFDTLLRVLVLGMMGSNKHDGVGKKCLEMLKDQQEGKCSIASDLRSVVYKTSLRRDSSVFDSLLKMIDETTSQEEKHRLYRVLGMNHDSKLLKRVIDFAMDKTRPQDIPFILNTVGACSPEGAHLLWDYFKTNHKTICDIYKDSDLMIRLTKFVSSNFVTVEDANDIEAFFGGLDHYVGVRGVAQNIENILVNAAWMQRDADKIKEYLEKQAA